MDVITGSIVAGLRNLGYRVERIDDTDATAPVTLALDAMAAPADLAASDIPGTVTRAFCFVDLCGFTAFTDSQGPHAATAELAAFRSVVRDVAAHRGVRVAKWVGDGAFLVGVESGTLVAFAADLVGRSQSGRLRVRGGIAWGEALLFDGDDYIGRCVNLASRLCDIAKPGAVLADEATGTARPHWVQRSRRRTITLKGIGEVHGVTELRCGDGVELPNWPVT